MIVLAAAAAAGGLLLLPEYQRQKVVSEIEKLQIPEYTEQADSLEANGDQRESWIFRRKMTLSMN